MRILVTGAGGQVGCEVAAHLPHHEVMALSRNQLDVANRDAVEAIRRAQDQRRADLEAWEQVSRDTALDEAAA